MFSLKKKNNKKEEGGGFLQNPKILEVNLVKDEVAISFDWRQNLSVLALVLILAVLFVTEIYFGLDQWEAQEAQQTQAIEAQVNITNAEVSKLKNSISPALAYKDKSAVFSNLLDNHIYWSNFFNWLEKNTLSSVKYQEFSGNLDGSYTLEATAQTYADISWQVKALTKDPLTEKVEVLKAESASDDETKPGKVNFQLVLKVKPEIFKK